MKRRRQEEITADRRLNINNLINFFVCFCNPMRISNDASLIQSGEIALLSDS
jgi:hypothetical protein